MTGTSTFRILSRYRYSIKIAEVCLLSLFFVCLSPIYFFQKYSKDGLENKQAPHVSKRGRDSEEKTNNRDGGTSGRESSGSDGGTNGDGGGSEDEGLTSGIGENGGIKRQRVENAGQIAKQIRAAQQVNIPTSLLLFSGNIIRLIL